MKHTIKAPYRQEFEVLWRDTLEKLNQCGERVIRVKLDVSCDSCTDFAGKHKAVIWTKEKGENQ